MAQTGSAPASGAPVVGILNYIHAVNDLDKTLAFYHEVFGLDGQPRPFPNPGVPALTNSPGVSLRLAVLKLPNAGFGFELTEFSGVPRQPAYRSTPIPARL
jgi:catechol 2,3-dioxygenase-like lactoylglutathione lyase family enzyme